MLDTTAPSTKELGTFGERLVAAGLRRLGYEVIHLSAALPFFHTDLFARKCGSREHEHLYIEVKTTSARRELAAWTHGRGPLSDREWDFLRRVNARGRHRERAGVVLVCPSLAGDYLIHVGHLPGFPRTDLECEVGAILSHPTSVLEITRGLPPSMPGPVRLRPGQGDAVLAILDQFSVGNRTVFLDGPVGSGKSLIHLLTARRLGGAYLTTPQTLLVDQYGTDTEPGAKFGGLAATLYGRRNYPCAYGLKRGDHEATAEGAPCTYLDDWPRGRLDPRTGRRTGGCPDLEWCPYYLAKARAQRHPVAVTTLAYLMVGIHPALTRPTFGWFDRPLLIVDEAHGLAEDLVGFYTVEIGEETFPGFDFAAIARAGDSLAYVRAALPEYLAAQEMALDARQREVEDPPKPEQMAAVKRQAAIVRRAEKYLDSLETKVDWVHTWDDSAQKHLWRPLEVAPFVAPLWERFDHILLSSATFFGVPTLARDLGLPGSWTVVSMPDTFPPSSAPVRLLGSVRLSKDSMAQELPNVLRELEHIADTHPGERGLVHCNSYPVARFIHDHAPLGLRRRLVFHDRGKDRNKQLDAWQSDGRADSIFVAVAMSEGLDLVEDMCRWQVVIKAPFGNLGDPWVVRRRDRPGGHRWYDERAVTDMLQACGRVMRSKEDRGVTYILDANAERLLRRHWASLPGWFRARVEAGAD